MATTESGGPAAAGFVRVSANKVAAGVPGPPLLSQANAPGVENCLGVARMAPGEVSADEVRHESGELMYVAAGSGDLRTEVGTIPVAAGDALHIPAGRWHHLANTGNEELVSVFCFPRPDRPATEARPVAPPGATD